MNLWMEHNTEAGGDGGNSPAHSRSARPSVQEIMKSCRTSVLGTDALWQWEHKTGFRNYKEHEVRRIEDAYQRGLEHVRLKTGKTNAPMEIFFHDMIQHDPVTGNSRRIRRVGSEGIFRRTRRVVTRIVRFVVEGHLQRRDFQRYEQMKREIHMGIDRQDYNVAEFYKKDGCCSAIARSGSFFAVSMMVVLLNAVWICIDANRDGRSGVDEAPEHVWGIEHAFCGLFTMELLIRFGAFQRKRNCLKDQWFCFDLGLVTLMITETWLIPAVILIFRTSDNSLVHGDWVILRVARVLRLTRLGRIARLLRAIPEAYMLLKGIATAIRSVMVTLLLLFALLLLFSVIFRQQAAEDAELAVVFPSVHTAMWLLLLHGTLLDSPMSLLNQVGALSPPLAALLLAFIFLSSFTVLNMLIGILCGVVSTVAENEKEQAAVQYLKSTLLDILECHDQDGDRAIHRHEFELLMRNPEVNITLTRFGVDVLDLISLADRLFEDKTRGTPWDETDGDEPITSLKVTLRQARGLRAADYSVLRPRGLSDPYCVCEIAAKAGTQFRTPTVKNSLEPVWNHEGHLKPFVPGDSIRFAVFDEDWGKEDDLLGRAVLHSSQVLPDGLETELPLACQEGDPAAGFISVKIEVLPIVAAQQSQQRPSLSFAQFLEAVLRLRGGNSASVHDIVELRGLLVEQFRRLHTHISRLGGDRESARSSTGCLWPPAASSTGALWPPTVPPPPPGPCRQEEASPRTQDEDSLARTQPSIGPSIVAISRATSRARLPGEVPSDEAEAQGLDCVFQRLDALDAGQRELRGEVQGLRAQLSDVQRMLQAILPAGP